MTAPSRLFDRLRRKPGNDDAEYGQAVVRLILVPLYSLYFAGVTFVQGFGLYDSPIFTTLYFIYLVAAPGLFVWIVRAPGYNFARRVAAMSADYLIITASLAVGDQILLPVYAVLLWVTVGNGIRYGARYLVAATLVALAALAVTALLNPYWRANPYITVTLVLTTILVPAYILSLLTRLQKAYAEALEANLAKSRFLAQASHDLRQPIHAMSLFTAILRDAGLTEEQRSMVDNIDRSLESLGRLFRSLLDISTLDSGSVEPKPASMAMAELFDDLRRQNQQPAQWAGVDLRFMPCSLNVHADQTLLTTVLQNLISNALKYAPGKPVLVGCRRHGETLAICVHDRGDGIAAHHLPLLFTEFYRVRERGDKDVDGVGLGLAIVKRLTALMGLNVTIRSERGRGTSVAITGVPITKANATAATTARQRLLLQRSAMEGLRILLVEDDADILEATHTLLKKWGCIVQAELAPPKTVAACDLVVTDYDLGGGVTGSDCLGHVRRALGREVPAIVLTGHDASRIRAELADPRIPILSKPVRPAELRSNLMAQKIKLDRLARMPGERG
ncbi:hybrid sensor histidine kinase/response regulator [Labrys okinawensis]|uniref:histidine kinase n=1 Tax=Labrys okinawensis TaxID=346911 RepID=A0A2S9QI12_9HYPH|nr:hybrid sensor histidine kinase/response regulator [Labrys okinawensis]PRH88975.1 hybrid sensor histidine kinase/response regulator [Labrys okinawensis]